MQTARSSQAQFFFWLEKIPNSDSSGLKLIILLVCSIILYPFCQLFSECLNHDRQEFHNKVWSRRAFGFGTRAKLIIMQSPKNTKNL